MVPTRVSPKVKPWLSWTAVSPMACGSMAVSVQRSTAATAPIITRLAGASVKRDDRANTTISASTPMVQSQAIMSPLSPCAFHSIAENV